MVKSISRRSVLGGVAGLTASALVSKAFAATQDVGNTLHAPDLTPDALASHEGFWDDVAKQYDVTPNITNLENGYWGIMSRPVQAVHHEMLAMINRDNTHYARQHYAKAEADVLACLAEFLNVGADELLFTRGASESLQLLIGGYNGLSPGDGVLLADLDYPAMKTAMRWLKDRRSADVIEIDLPEPASFDGFVAAYAAAFDANPHIKLCLLTHLNNHTGAIHPVRAIADMARTRGIDCIVDAAHSVGQVDFDLSEQGADFVGINLHKWIGAPIGNGLAYVRRGRVPDIDTFMGVPGSNSDIRNLLYTGTTSFAARLTIPAALAFHQSIGTANKEARLRYLRNIWVGAVRDLDAVDVLTPDDPRMVAALTSFRLRGMTSTKDNNALAARLRDEFGILTVRRTSPARGDCIRITPSIYNAPADSRKLADALRVIAG